ncbi:MAG: hypothetical protein ACRD0B_11335, partial [Acidimicrobiales bacterium]
MGTGEHAIAGLGGAGVIVWTVASAVVTVVIPRGIPARLTRWVFAATFVPFRLAARRLADVERRETVLAAYGPTGLLALPVAWLALVLAGGTLLDWSVGVDSWRAAFVESGASLFTLGFAAPRSLPETWVDFALAGLGLGLVALLIAYLPATYASYSRREVLVTGLETQAGSPPSGTSLLERIARIDGLDDLVELWEEWTRWFADLEETHVSTPSLVFFRSPQAERSWVTAAGAVLDAASLLLSSVDVERQPQAALCIRAGYIALRRIAAYHRIPFDPDPRATDPISITRDELDAAWQRLSAAGASLRPERELAWASFRGWRVNYDAVLLGLAALTMAPPAPWSSDRPLRGGRLAVNQRRRPRA